MQEASQIVEAIKTVVTDPSAAHMLPLFVASFLNDLVGIFPFSLVIAGQLLFLDSQFTLALSAKLLVFVAVPVGVGSALGSVPLYALAYFGGKPVINKYHRFLHFSWQDVEKVNRYFHGTWYDEIIFFILRSAPILPSIPMDIGAGILRMRFLPFFVLTVTGSIVRMMLTLVLVGMSVHGLSYL
ncbi:MAG: VTT domain-containing protein [Candidatus Zambryskibacteria bacterium]|nr:VTT domain-containing protein [Candidatus Zambryskibacteria bacterium]